MKYEERGKNMKEEIKKHQSSIANVDANIMALLTYIGGAILAFVPGLKFFSWAVPLVIYFLEKKSDFVKKHAVQSISLNIVSSIFMFIIVIVLGGIISSFSNPYYYGSGLAGLALVGLLSTILGIVVLIVVIIASVKAYNYKSYTIPLLGKLNSAVDKILSKIAKANNKESNKS